MPHYPKPFFRPKKNRWYVQLDGKHVNLGPDRDSAFLRYHEVMRQHAAGRPAERAPEPARPDALPVVEALDRFLDHCHRHAAARTYESYRERLGWFARFLKLTGRLALAVADLKPFHVLEWLDAHPAWQPGMRRGAIQAVQRALNWAVEVGLLESSPVARMKKPPQGKRERAVTEAEFAEMLALTPEGPFKDLLRFAWASGCRPQEAIRLEARRVDPGASRAVLPPREAKGRRRYRVIYLTDPAKEILTALATRFPSGPLFRNEGGRPWTRFAVNCAFSRLQIRSGYRRMKELGIDVSEGEVAELAATLKPTKVVKGKEVAKRPAELRKEARQKLRYKLARRHALKACLYLARHSWGTLALMRGVDPVTVGALMGHADPSMIARVYSHVSQDPAFMLNSAKKAAGG